MEPRKVARRGRMIYECPECGYQMEMTEAHAGKTTEEAPVDAEPDAGDDEEDFEDEEDEEKEENAN